MTELREFTATEHHTWTRLYERQLPRTRTHIHPLFGKGLAALGIGPERIPRLSEVSARLFDLTGFECVPVEGLEDHADFFKLLAARRFPVGNFIRSERDLSYTPAPDVFHDLFGHVPWLADPGYADFCARIGVEAGRRPKRIAKFARFFWFTVEFGLVRTSDGIRALGAGLASSHAECAFALGDEPERVPFSLPAVLRQKFRIDEFQRRLFVLPSLEALYCSDSP